MLALAGAACPTAECEEKAALVDQDAWRLVPAADDPFNPPEDAPLCPQERVYTDDSFPPDLALNVDTNDGCGWATVEQSTLADVAAGESIFARVFYFSQNTFPAAEAQLALAIGGDVVWSEQIPIPVGQAQLTAPTIEVTAPIAAGTPIHFHVGNHGNNTWNLLEVSRVRKVVCPPE